MNRIQRGTLLLFFLIYTIFTLTKRIINYNVAGLQIKTPDGSMATAQQLRAAASEAPAGSGPGLPTYNNPTIVNSNKILDQVININYYNYYYHLSFWQVVFLLRPCYLHISALLDIAQVSIS